MTEFTHFTVGELARRAGVSIRTLHYYEQLGLLSPIRQGAGQHRLYDQRQVERLQQIAALQYLRMPLKEIRKTLDDGIADSAWREILAGLRNKLTEQIDRLQQVLEVVERLASLPRAEDEEDLRLRTAFIRGMQTEKEQRRWLEEERGSEVTALLFDRPLAQKTELDRLAADFTREIKRRVGEPVDSPEVRELIERYMDSLASLIGDEVITGLGPPEELDLTGLEPHTAAASPFSAEEEEWLNRAMEAVMLRRVADDARS